MEFCFDRNPAGEVGWRKSDKEHSFLISTELADECVNLLLDYIPKERWKRWNKKGVARQLATPTTFLSPAGFSRFPFLSLRTNLRLAPIFC